MSKRLKVARTFIENEPEQFGVYTPRKTGGPFNGDLVVTCRTEEGANLFVELVEAATEVVEEWEAGDLAGAVRGLAAVITKATGAPQP